MVSLLRPPGLSSSPSILPFILIIVAFIWAATVTVQADAVQNRRGHGSPWTARKIQTLVLEYVFEELSLPDRRQVHVVREAAQEFKVPRTTIYRWLSLWRTNHELPCDTISFYRNLRNKLGSGSSAPVHGNAAFDNQHLEALSRIVRDKPRLYLDEYVSELYNETGLIFYPSTVHRNLCRLGVSLTVIQDLAREADAAERSVFMKTLNLLVYYPS